MPTLNLTRRECSLLDQALWAYIGTDEHPDVQALQSIRDKLVELAWDVSDGDTPGNNQERKNG